MPRSQPGRAGHAGPASQVKWQRGNFLTELTTGLVVADVVMAGGLVGAVVRDGVARVYESSEPGSSIVVLTPNAIDQRASDGFDAQPLSLAAVPSPIQDTVGVLPPCRA